MSVLVDQLRICAGFRPETNAYMQMPVTENNQVRLASSACGLLCWLCRGRLPLPRLGASAGLVQLAVGTAAVGARPGGAACRRSQHHPASSACACTAPPHACLRPHPPCLPFHSEQFAVCSKALWTLQAPAFPPIAKGSLYGSSSVPPPVVSPRRESWIGLCASQQITGPSPSTTPKMHKRRLPKRRLRKRRPRKRRLQERPPRKRVKQECECVDLVTTALRRTQGHRQAPSEIDYVLLLSRVEGRRLRQLRGPRVPA